MKDRRYDTPRHRNVFHGTPFEDAPASPLSAKAEAIIEAARKRRTDGKGSNK